GGLPDLLAAHGAAIPASAGLLVPARGLVADGHAVVRPSAYVAARVPARAVACLAGGDRSLVVASEDPGWARELTALLRAGGFDARRSADVTGVEPAGIAAAGIPAVAGPEAGGGQLLAGAGTATGART
ncbi:MAG: phospholipid/glycerol acyltransferase, partial [Solirubrobacterales bacterium]|nr:phospholipid/glycerol acyltransferase [Solirubrobacterales bacterium]